MDIKCSECGKELGANAIEGLCPECLMKVGLGSKAGTEGRGTGGHFTPPKPEELATHFPQLDILELIGRGGMGAVYKARQKQLGRIVALKILPPGVGDEAAFAERFAREARALAALNHPGIVTLYEFGETNGLFFFLMEFVDGVNLRQLLQAGRVAPREALAIVPQICDALQYAHDQGIVHRDIKPENILLDRKGRVKVADFGLARLMGLEGETAGAGSGAAASASLSLTEAGKVMGTPQYMAPEQREHPMEVDHRADIYSLGVVLYQMLTGELPGKPLQAPSRKVHLDVRLDEVVLRALEKAPERRYQQASGLKTAVEMIATAPGQAVPSSAREPGIPPAPPDRAAGPPRFSRMAILGAAWVPLFFVAALASVWTSAPIMVPAGTRLPGPAWWQVLLMFTVLPLGIAAPFGTTILGWIAVSQIRRSSGRIYGLGLAVCDGLLFPLQALDALLAFFLMSAFAPLISQFNRWGANNGWADFHNLFVGLALLLCVAADWWICRKVWHAVNKPLELQPPGAAAARKEAPPKPARSGLTGWGIAVFLSVLIMLGLAAANWIHSPAGIHERQPQALQIPDAKAEGSQQTVPHPSEDSPYPGRPTFGPVIELFLPNILKRGGHEALDLHSGKLLSLPRLTFKSDHASLHRDDLLFLAWLQTNKVDLMVCGESEQSDRLHLLCIKTKLSVFAGEFASATPSECLVALQSGTILQAADKRDVDVAYNQAGVALYGLPPPVVTLAFETREGRQGLLQFTGYPENPRGVKIRYKLVQNSGSAGNSHGSAQGEPADVLSKILTDFPYGIWNKPLAHYARNRRPDGWFGLINFPPVEDSWVHPDAEATGRPRLRLPADASGEQIAAKADAGDLLVPDLDHLAPVRGTMLAPLESGKLPEGFPPQDQSTLKKVLSYKTRPEIVQAITAYNSVHPEDKWVRLEEGGRYGALRPDGELLLITAFGTGDDKSVQLIPIGRVGDGLPEAPDPKRTSRATDVRKAVETEPTADTASAAKSGEPVMPTNTISVGLGGRMVITEATTNEAPRTTNSTSGNSPGAAPILARDVSLNFANPAATNGAFAVKARASFDIDFHDQTMFAVTTMLVGQSDFVVGLVEGPAGTRVEVQDMTKKDLVNEIWAKRADRFEKLVTLPVDYDRRHYSCPVLLEFGRLKGEKFWGTYRFCAYLSGHVSLGGAERNFELVNTDRRITFASPGPDENPMEVLGIDLNGDGKIDPGPDGGEIFAFDDAFEIGARYYRLAEANPSELKVGFQEVTEPNYVKAQETLKQAFGVAGALEETLKKQDDLKLAQNLALQVLERFRAYNDLVRGTPVQLPQTNLFGLAGMLRALQTGNWEEATNAADSRTDLTDPTEQLEVLAALQRAQSFGPVVERILPFKWKGPYCLDFETGKLTTPPDRLTVTSPGWDLWCEQSGADAIAEQPKSGPVLRGQRCKFVKVDTARWDTIKPARVVKELIGNNLAGPAQIPNRQAVPATFLFRTREDTRGVLQITGFSDNPPVLKIRYKLVEGLPAVASTNAASTK